MAKTKTLKGTTAEDWRAYILKFRYKGKSYNLPVLGNFVLRDLSVGEIKDFLNEIPGRLAYWGDFQKKVLREIFDMKEDYELWSKTLYMEVDAEYPKKTEGWKNSRVMLDNATEYRLRRTALRDMEDIDSTIGIAMHSYNQQVWTLREIARLTYAEMSNIELRGKGSLSEIR